MTTTNSPPADSPAAAMLGAALQYLAAGISLIPISSSGDKSPAWRLLPETGRWPGGNPRRGWAPLKARLPTENELHRWFGHWGPPPGLAVVAGRISGGLEAIDIDSTEHVEPWLAQVREQAPALLDRLVLVRSPRPGLHAYYRCSEIGGSTKLARKYHYDDSGVCTDTGNIVETKGEGGYALVPPTSGYCHPTGRPYTYLTDRTLAEVQTISADERALLFELSRSFGDPPQRRSRPAPRSRPRRPANPFLPGDDFNARADWATLLESHGWTYSHSDADRIQHWARPGKDQGTSATVDFANADLLHVFTSSAEPLEPDRSYSKFQFITLMDYGGDYRAAARALRDQGYGQPKLEAGRRSHSRGGASRGFRGFRGSRGRRPRPR